MSIEDKDLGLMDMVERNDKPLGISKEEAFMQCLLQFLELDNLPVRPSTQFGEYLGEHPSMFGEEVHWFKLEDYRETLVECEPLLRKPDYGFGDDTDEIVSFEGLGICIGSTEGRKAFIVTYHGLLFLFAEKTGFTIELTEDTVTIVNKSKGTDLSFNLKYKGVETQPVRNGQLARVKFVINFLDNLSSDDYIIESASSYNEGMGMDLSRFPIEGKWFKPGQTLDSVIVAEPTLLKAGVVDCKDVNLFVGNIDNEDIVVMTYAGVVYKLPSSLGFSSKIKNNKLIIKSNDGFIHYAIEA